MLCSMDFLNICLNETGLDEMCFDHKLFPDSFTVLIGSEVLNIRVVVV
jgi:hypothetical protein